jgi:hypothetical protein
MNMDYSAFYSKILYLYIVAFAGVLAGIGLLVFGGVYFLKHYLKKSKAAIDIIGFIICILVFNIVSFFAANFFLDIPNAVSNNYIVATGTAQGRDAGGDISDSRGFEFKKDDGEVIRITVIYTPVYEGDRFEVIYLPNTKYAAIVKKL